MWSRLNEYSGFLQNTVPNAWTYSHGQHGNILKNRPYAMHKRCLKKMENIKTISSAFSDHGGYSWKSSYGSSF